jgi:hypothetical protein
VAQVRGRHGVDEAAASDRTPHFRRTTQRQVRRKMSRPLFPRENADAKNKTEEGTRQAGEDNRGPTLRKDGTTGTST